MKYFVVEGIFSENHPKGAALEAEIKVHVEYLRAGIDSGTILFMGPKTESGGGFIFVKGEDKQDIQDLCDNDPMFKSGTQWYKITEFRLTDCQDPLRYWFR